MAAAAINKSEWLLYVKDEVDETNSGVCIFGIAHPLLRLKPESYIPQVISIGPNHYRKLQQYEETDTYKLKVARALEKECSPFEFTMLVDCIGLSKDRIRACYEKHTPYSMETLSWMLALDTSFILHYLKSISRPYGVNIGEETGYMWKPTILHSKRKTPLWYAMKNDILMLENQVPMFLLLEALCVIADCIQSDPTQKSRRRLKQKLDLTEILQAACLHCNPFVREENYLPEAFDVDTKSHVLDYLYGYVTASSRETVPHNSEPVNRESGGMFCLFREELIHHAGGTDSIKRMMSATTDGNLPCATELSEAGIKFSSYGSGHLEEIKFERKTSTFFLPKIKIDDSTEVVLRNLVALELNLQTEQKPLTRYTYLMDHLIDTERDVAVLKRCGILISKMGSNEEVAEMWNSMSKSTWENQFDPVDKAIEEANKHYSSKWRVLLAQFQKRHCSKPWLIMSAVSAAILLSLTAVQVFCLFYKGCNK